MPNPTVLGTTVGFVVEWPGIIDLCTWAVFFLSQNQKPNQILHTFLSKGPPLGSNCNPTDILNNNFVHTTHAVSPPPLFFLKLGLENEPKTEDTICDEFGNSFWFINDQVGNSVCYSHYKDTVVCGLSVMRLATLLIPCTILTFITSPSFCEFIQSCSLECTHLYQPVVQSTRVLLNTSTLKHIIFQRQCKTDTHSRGKQTGNHVADMKYYTSFYNKRKSLQICEN